MIVCVCNNISNKDILKYLSVNSNNNFNDIQKDLSCCNKCEICKHDIIDIISEDRGNKLDET